MIIQGWPYQQIYCNILPKKLSLIIKRHSPTNPNPASMKNHLSPVRAGLLLFCLWSHPPGAWAATAEIDPITAPVQALHDSLLEIMRQSQSAAYEARHALMEKTVADHFDIPLIARVVLGRHWQALEVGQQQAFIDLFARLTIATYVSRFDAFDGQSFRTLATRALRENRYLVKTAFEAPGAEAVSLDYLVQQTGAGWKIISVIAAGVNDLSLKRAEYGGLIRDQGYPALVGSLEEKIRALRRPDGADSK